MTRALCPVLLALAATVGAADTAVHVADVRLAFGIGPMPDELEGTITSPASSAGNSWRHEYDSVPGLSFTLGAMSGTLDPVGLLWGAQIRSITGEMDFESLQVNDGTPKTAKDFLDATGDDLPGMGFSQIGLAANLGFGVALSPGFHLELVGIAGLDWTSLDSVAILAGTTNTLITQEGKGRGFTVGGRFGAYWTNPEGGWQFGLEGEYTSTNSDIETSYLNTTIESNLVNSGVSLRGVLGSRF